MNDNLTKDEIIALAITAGFEPHQPGKLSGETEDDELLYVDEYPVGESVLAFAELVLNAQAAKRRG